MAARLKETYINEVAPALMKKFEYKSVMQIPKLDKIVVNIACGEARENSKVLRPHADHRSETRDVQSEEVDR